MKSLGKGVKKKSGRRLEGKGQNLRMAGDPEVQPLSLMGVFPPFSGFCNIAFFLDIWTISLPLDKDDRRHI